MLLLVLTGHTLSVSSMAQIPKKIRLLFSCQVWAVFAFILYWNESQESLEKEEISCIFIYEFVEMEINENFEL